MTNVSVRFFISCRFKPAATVALFAKVFIFRVISYERAKIRAATVRGNGRSRIVHRNARKFCGEVADSARSASSDMKYVNHNLIYIMIFW